jgi:hypothetical protein
MYLGIRRFKILLKIFTPKVAVKSCLATKSQTFLTAATKRFFLPQAQK